MRTKLRLLLTLFLMFAMHSVLSQEKTVTGQITDRDQLPLPGATVVVKGTNNGTQTDFDGNYSIQTREGDILIFSYVGQKSEQRTVGASNVIDVTLVQDAQALQEVVVTGQGIRREKKALGFSQQSVGGDQLVQSRETDIADAMAGKVSGVQIIGNNSSTFGASEIRLRGNENLLYVIDGIRVRNTSDINPDNVSDISVLKGASATAIYGPEGRNGVVIITTKRGTPGTAQINVNYSMGMNMVSELPEYQNEYGGGYSQNFKVFDYDPSTDPPEWAAFEGHLYPEFNADESWGPRLNGQLVRHWDSWAPGTPQFGELRPWTQSPNDVRSFYNTALVSNTSVTFSKAGEDYNVASTMSYVDQEGVVPNSENKFVKVSVNASYNITDKLKFIANLNFEDNERLNDPDQNYGNFGSNFNQWWQRQLDFDRLKDYVRNGQTVSWNIKGPRDTKPLYWDMPYLITNENLEHWEKNAYFGKIGVVYDINDHLNLTLDYRKTFYSYVQDDRATTLSILDPASYSEEFDTYDREDLFAMLNYHNRFFNNTIDVDIAIGAEKVKQKHRELEAETVGNLTIPEFYNLAGSKDPVDAANRIVREKRDGLFTKASVGYKSMLYLDGSYRLDWSSTAKPSDNRIESYGASLLIRA